MGMRVRLRIITAAADVVALASANILAVWVRSEAHLFMRVDPMGFRLDWSLGVLVVAMFAVLYVFGLYEREAFVSRPLHLWTLARAATGAFIVSAVAVYLLKSDRVDQSRFILLLTFVLFVPLVGILRLWLVDRVFVRWCVARHPASLLIGESRETDLLAERLNGLRGFSRLEVIAPCVLLPDIVDSLSALLDDRASAHAPVGAIFIDTLAVGPREVFDIVHVARLRDIDVYVLSGLLGPLEGSRLLNALFQAPVIRVRRSMEQSSSHTFKRAFDVVGSAVLLVLSSPLVAVLAAAIKVTSPGPVFYTQTRVGRVGVPFDFYKFRSMVVNRDDSGHASYVKSFIAGEAQLVETSDGDAVFKTVDDPRITPIGRVIRKYSLDEIPQFWNVLRGDMSLVGPRPPLPYEVEHYDDWALNRLMVPPGVTGMWQVEGRSRVSFEEMVLQDLMYARNMRFVVDVELCLRTVPAALLGYGGG
jgi:exopolysaccharide biosynthesis polyprenyl glycosylphosphotransferase